MLGNNRGSKTMMGAGRGAGKLYQSNQNPKKPKFDPKGKLVIQNYKRDLTYAVFYGWDLIMADELEDSYVFQLMPRESKKFRIYITLGRELQQPEFPSSEMFYQCYIHDDAGEWSKTVWLNAQSINYMKFWTMIESVVDEYHPILPF